MLVKHRLVGYICQTGFDLNAASVKSRVAAEERDVSSYYIMVHVFWFFFIIIIIINEPPCDKTYNRICVTSKGSDQPVYPHSMARVLIYHSLDSLEAIEGTCDQRRL